MHPPELLTATQQVLTHADELLDLHLRLYAIDLTLYLPSIVDDQDLRPLFDWMRDSACQHHLMGFVITHQRCYLEGGRVRGIAYLLPSANTDNWYAALNAYVTKRWPGTALRDWSSEPKPVHIRDAEQRALLTARLTVLMLRSSGIPMTQCRWSGSLALLEQIYRSLRV